MHSVEPHYAYRHLYIASEDQHSPFYNRSYSEFEYTHTVYNYYIHPQWDEIGSSTLYVKLLFTDYIRKFCIIEFMGEWNDTLHNDIMELKRNVIDILLENGICKYILIGENIMNMHAMENDYYQEWFEDIEDGWITALNFRKHVIEELKRARIDHYIFLSEKFKAVAWRKHTPFQLFEVLEQSMNKYLNP